MRQEARLSQRDRATRCQLEVTQGHRYATRGPKNWHRFCTLPNVKRFSKLFHCQNQEKICDNTVTKDRTTPEVCRYTTGQVS